MTNKKNYDVKDLSLAEAGRNRIEWAGVRCRFNQTHWERQATEPLKGIRLGVLFATLRPETANPGINLKSRRSGCYFLRLQSS